METRVPLLEGNDRDRRTTWPTDIPCFFPRMESVARKVNEYGRTISVDEYSEMNCNDNIMALGVFLLRKEFMQEYVGGTTWKARARHSLAAFWGKKALMAALQATEIMQQVVVAPERSLKGCKISAILQTFNTVFNMAGEPELPFFTWLTDECKCTSSLKLHALSVKLQRDFPDQEDACGAMTSAALQQLVLLLVLHTLVIWPVHEATVHKTGTPYSGMDAYMKPALSDEEPDLADAFFGIDLVWLGTCPKSIVIELANALDVQMDGYQTHQESRLLGTYIDFLASLSATLRSEIDQVTTMQQKLLAALSTLAFTLVSFAFHRYFN